MHDIDVLSHNHARQTHAAVGVDNSLMLASSMNHCMQITPEHCVEHNGDGSNKHVSSINNELQTHAIEIRCFIALECLDGRAYFVWGNGGISKIQNKAQKYTDLQSSKNA